MLGAILGLALMSPTGFAEWEPRFYKRAGASPGPRAQRN
jgi:hypothetical protein